MQIPQSADAGPAGRRAEEGWCTRTTRGSLPPPRFTSGPISENGLNSWRSRVVAPIPVPSPASGEGWKAAALGVVQSTRNACGATHFGSHRPSSLRVDHLPASGSPPFPRGLIVTHIAPRALPCSDSAPRRLGRGMPTFWGWSRAAPAPQTHVRRRLLRRLSDARNRTETRAGDTRDVARSVRPCFPPREGHLRVRQPAQRKGVGVRESGAARGTRPAPRTSASRALQSAWRRIDWHGKALGAMWVTMSPEAGKGRGWGPRATGTPRATASRAEAPRTRR